MTRIAARKTRLQFEADSTIRYRGKLREIVVEVSDGYVMVLRLKGTRQRLPISFAGIYNQAAKIEAERQRAERKARRRARG